ncbi:Hypothetical_protein [Hexamita inflata]|uniref:Hypothetical_protein n=1 Tax=Hexamita inflata TaxID=28002 RepID=A0AA86NIX1_9EUKA|nr:Hypothetical protein HINF_LOCUS7431 [Hexamita inflata]CAI9919789.1 Hypothetical protein HINF_LOCUS7434 [Hexamita inflata]CAI9928475.1 Hypothetical protein HINF_LOCUS16120 [Hexamita inflata]CAI9928478.1 Hypothetical protein HINF_LOCUS16123 [Hexamita inflata]
MVYILSACLHGQHTSCWRSGLIPSRRWKYPSNSVASWPSSFRFDFTYFLLGRQGCLFQNIFNVLDFLQAFYFLQEYLALGSVDEFTFKERLEDQYQVGLKQLEKQDAESECCKHNI